MPVTKKMINKILSAVLLALIIFVGLWMALFWEYEIPSPSGWPSNIKIYRRVATGLHRVVDTESGRLLFIYLDAPAVQPVRIEKIDDNHWNVIFEKPEYKNSNL
jgi:hypothetical protein